MDEQESNTGGPGRVQAPVQPIHEEEPVYAGQSLLSIIEERIKQYKEAEAVAKHNGDSSKVKYF